MIVSAIQIGRHLRLLLPLLVLLTVPGIPSSRGAHADPVLPLMRGSVVDESDVLEPEQEQSLAKQLDALKLRSNIELVVVTIPSLQGYSIEQWGKALGEGWYVGGKNGLGALLIVAPNERRVRIEVGEALSPLLSDVESSVIIDTRIIPRFRTGEMSGGILAGVDAMIGEVMPSMTPVVPPTAPQVAPTRAITGVTFLASAMKWIAILFAHGVGIALVVLVFRKLRGSFTGGIAGRPNYGSSTVVRRREFNSGATISFNGSQSSRNSWGGRGSNVS